SPESIISATTGGESPILNAPSSAIVVNASSSSGDDNSPVAISGGAAARGPSFRSVQQAQSTPQQQAPSFRPNKITSMPECDERRGGALNNDARNSVLPDLLPRSKTPPQPGAADSISDEPSSSINDENRPKLLQKKEKSFLVYGFGAGGTVERPGRSTRDVSEVTVN
uniref:Uncharacterized protein n=1 Tax=Romanomermis culicivorax TaxID=13658 RepID=A0A915JRG0_ROMCU